jgi:hypothetical protein
MAFEAQIRIGAVRVTDDVLRGIKKGALKSGEFKAHLREIGDAFKKNGSEPAQSLMAEHGILLSDKLGPLSRFRTLLRFRSKQFWGWVDRNFIKPERAGQRVFNGELGWLKQSQESLQARHKQLDAEMQALRLETSVEAQEAFIRKEEEWTMVDTIFQSLTKQRDLAILIDQQARKTLTGREYRSFINGAAILRSSLFENTFEKAIVRGKNGESYVDEAQLSNLMRALYKKYERVCAPVRDALEQNAQYKALKIEVYGDGKAEASEMEDGFSNFVRTSQREMIEQLLKDGHLHPGHLPLLERVSDIVRSGGKAAA